ncbi:uncharacterized protein TNCV_2160351 [Trichonephila clavipes]|nr:uncharacterized protein TNCV_2160351 [Trichonephila clavipes]
MPQLQDKIDNFILQLQLDGAPLHWSVNARDYLDEHLPHPWIGRIGDYRMPLTQWAFRSPNLTLRDFFEWRYVKDKVFVPILPVHLAELNQCISASISRWT